MGEEGEKEGKKRKQQWNLYWRKKEVFDFTCMG